MAEPASDGDDVRSAASHVAEAVELVRRLCIASSNAGIYSIAHPLAQQSITSAYDFLGAIVERKDYEVVFNMSGDTVLIGQFPVETRNPLVAQFMAKLNALHMNNLHFKPGLTEAELTAFYQVLAMKPDDVEAAGGIRQVLERHAIVHITMSGAAYVVVTEDQKVVDRNAKVVETDYATKDEADTDMLNDLFGRILKNRDDREWLIETIKNSPNDAAELIGRAFQQVLQAPDRMAGREDLVAALMQNVRYLARDIAESDAAGDRSGTKAARGPDNVKDAILAIEADLRTRTAGIGTSGQAMKFLDDILGVVASYSDQVRADRLSGLFLKGQAGLKKTEELLRTMARPGESTDDLLARLRDQMIQSGLSEDDIGKLVQAAAKRPAPRRKKSFDDALRDGLARKVAGLGVDAEQRGEVMNGLATFVENKLAEKERTHRQEVKQLQGVVSRRDTAIDRLANGGVVLWDAGGVIEHLNDVARKLTGYAKGDRVGQRLIDRLAATQPATCNPAGDELSGDESGGAGDDRGEARLLAALSRVIRDAAGSPIGVILNP